ncbi:phage portal protein [uncultured Allobaculum sp.]|uniref:phage portal protein n=1 Tax=uncultured Allobaculum sp. TaxID=1187017 RepID=UPI002582EC3E|nr:phage portal protein [uncultured Allobaculum sp.]
MADNLSYLKQLLANKRTRSELRYRHYEMKSHPQDLFSTAELKAWNLRPVLGWCSKAVDSLADRLQVKGWKNDNFNLETIFRMNNWDIFFDSAILSALINGCSFVYISEDETGFPRVEVIDGMNATGIIDPVTNLLKEGYAILERDKNDAPVREAYFETGRTTFYEKGQEPYSVANQAPAPLLVPILYRPDAKRPFGHSRISRAMMSLVNSAVRTTKRSEVAAEFYSVPQKYVLGTDPDAEALDKWKSTISSLMEISKDEDGDRPTVGQFTQQSMQPHMDQIRTFAALFAGESGLTMDDLGFVSDNPSSAEAIKASHESLRVLAEKAQRVFGSCFLNVGYIAACLRDNFPYQRRQFYLTEPVWRPAFKPDAAALSGIGDGAIKINQAVPGYFNKDNLTDLTGIDPSEMEIPEEDDL